jgi:hypothetical protein
MAARFQIGSLSISPDNYSKILVPLQHLHTNAKPSSSPQWIAALTPTPFQQSRVRS